jgi:hypothetical protein
VAVAAGEAVKRVKLTPRKLRLIAKALRPLLSSSPLVGKVGYHAIGRQDPPYILSDAEMRAVMKPGPAFHNMISKLSDPSVKILSTPRPPSRVTTILPRWLTGGRPMKRLRIGEFRDVVSGKMVYYFRDRYGRGWMANGSWSWFRVRAPRRDSKRLA